MKTAPVTVTTDMRAIENRVIEQLTRDPQWRDCPDCRQPATGRYANKHGCSRCGWTEGTFVRRLTTHF